MAPTILKQKKVPFPFITGLTREQQSQLYNNFKALEQPKTTIPDNTYLPPGVKYGEYILTGNQTLPSSLASTSSEAAWQVNRTSDPGIFDVISSALGNDIPHVNGAGLYIIQWSFVATVTGAHTTGIHGQVGAQNGGDSEWTQAMPSGSVWPTTSGLAPHGNMTLIYDQPYTDGYVRPLGAAPNDGTSSTVTLLASTSLLRIARVQSA